MEFVGASASHDKVFVIQPKGPDEGTLLVRQPDEIGAVGDQKVAIGERGGHRVVGGGAVIVRPDVA